LLRLFSPSLCSDGEGGCGGRGGGTPRLRGERILNNELVINSNRRFANTSVEPLIELFGGFESGSLVMVLAESGGSRSDGPPAAPPPTSLLLALPEAVSFSDSHTHTQIHTHTHTHTHTQKHTYNTHTPAFVLVLRHGLVRAEGLLTLLMCIHVICFPLFMHRLTKLSRRIAGMHEERTRSVCGRVSGGCGTHALEM
jgi:hypothetical protein